MLSAEADAVGQEAFLWKLTWLGEPEQEPDMACYAKESGEVLAGPGISRCSHGAFMLTYSPFRLADIWTDPFLDWTVNKPERLLATAIDYSMQHNAVYVAARPPSSRTKRFADKVGKKVIYLPIGMFSPPLVAKMRRFHVLDGHRVRRYAKEYIS